MSNKSKKTKSKNKTKTNNTDISFLNGNKLIDLNKIKQLYKKTLRYLKNMNQEEFEKLKNEISKKNIKRNKINIIRNIFSSFNVKSSFEYIPKIDLSAVKLIQERKCFKDYNKIDTLGQGAFGITYLVEKDDKKYALKEQKITIVEWKPSKEDQLILIKNEILISQKMGELGIGPKIYDYYTCVEKSVLQVYILMEYMDGGTLKEWALKNNFTKQHKKEILEKIENIHKEGVIHYDLHLENVLVKENNGKPEFYISDFGIGLTLDSIKERDHKKDFNMFNDALIFLEENKYLDTIASLFIINGLI
jgi:tRNA A-37 threonylcarbamoyl transferase component Bud32